MGTEGTIQILNMITSDTHLCMDIGSVIKVLPLVKLEPIPSAPAYYVGLMNFAGVSVPVVDLGIYLGIARRRKYSLDAQILLCGNVSLSVGFIVDDIQGLNTISLNDIQKNDDLSVPFKGTLIQGTELYLDLDSEQLLSNFKDVKENKHDSIT